MSSFASTLADTGLEVTDLDGDAEFASRPAHVRDVCVQLEAMRRIARAFVEQPETILQELVEAAVKLCGADSAGISIEKEGGTESGFYQWVATAGQYSGFMDAVLPRSPSACGICLERGRPQHFRVRQRFFDLMGIEAPLVNDGLLLPWRVEDTRGTIFIMAHDRTVAFDWDDCRLMQLLADFAAMGVREQRQRKQMIERAGAMAAAEMANRLAHEINNPLQTLTNVLYLAAEGYHGEDAKVVGQQTMADLRRLSALVSELLALQFRNP